MKYPFKNIVISGGGSKMICAGGTIRELERRGILSRLDKFAGTSSGALLATALCIGYNSGEISEVLIN